METRLVNPHDCQYIQSRVSLDVFAVAEYEDLMERGIIMDPCKGILCDDGAIIIYDGNHRAEAAKSTGAMIEVELSPGTAEDADWKASGANTKHGLRRTASDIEKSVKAALRHPNAQTLGDREIARHCGVDHKTVGKYRKELEASGERPQIETRTVTRNGTEYQMTIPMPEEPEPEPTRIASPMCYDQHMHTASDTSPTKDHEWEKQNLVTKKDTIGLYDDYQCARCGTKVRRYGLGPILYNEPCKPDPANIEKPEGPQEPEISDPFPAIQKAYPSKIITVKCLDCGEEFQRPEDRPDLQLCLECWHERRRERERLVEAHQQHGLIQKPNEEAETPDDGPQYCADCGGIIVPGYEASYQGKVYHPNCHLRIVHPETEAMEEECDFCEQSFPVAQLYFSKYDCEAICRVCASKALHALLTASDPDTLADCRRIKRELHECTSKPDLS